jgi:hypothetical protein
VTTGSVSWSGSYVPISSPVGHGGTNGGTYHTVLTAGSGFVQFNAYPITGNTTDYCLMTFSISNTTGAISGQAAVARGTAGVVTCGKAGPDKIDFTASAMGH